jgi:hypothetical protein
MDNNRKTSDPRSDITTRCKGDLDRLSVEELTSQLTSQAALVAAETAAFLRMLEAFDRRGCWEGDGIVSCAHWMNWQLGTSRRTAYEQLRVAHALADLDAIAEAFDRGELSYSRVRAITRIATKDSEVELLDLARVSTGQQLETMVRAFRRMDDLGKPTPPPRGPELHRREDQHGRVVLTVTLSPVDAEQAWKAIHSAMCHDPQSSLAEKRADAFVALADSYLANGPSDRSGSDRSQIVVHTSHDGTGATLADGTPIDLASQQRLECDAARISLTIDPVTGDLDPGRRSSGVSERLRRQLILRDRTCRWPGCGGEHHLHAHHVIFRSNGGLTQLDNLVLLCGHHHRVLHNNGHTISRDADGTWQVDRPDGTTIERQPHAMSVPRNTRTDRLPHPDTIVSRWLGDRLDVTALNPIDVRPRQSRSAETSSSENETSADVEDE